MIRHGIDLVAIGRVERLLETHGRQFAERCFTEAEQAYAEQGLRRRAERYAVRFAAKEAALKALGTGWRGGIRWRDVEVRRDADGKPSLHLSGRCRELADELGLTGWALSLSHTEGHAMASVIAWGRGDGPRGGDPIA